MEDHAAPEVTFPGDDLSELIGSRICHDLTSPLGAIGNGVELLALVDDRALGDAELALIRDSVVQAQARVRLLRVAFGAAGSGASVGAAEVARLAQDLAQTGRIQIDWPVTGDLPRAEAKLLVLLLLCLGSALPQGGEVAVRHTGVGWVLTGHGRRLRDLAGEWQRFDPQAAAAPPTAPLVHFAAAALAATALGRQVVVLAEDDGIRLSVPG